MRDGTFQQTVGVTRELLIEISNAADPLRAQALATNAPVSLLATLTLSDSVPRERERLTDWGACCALSIPSGVECECTLH